MSQMLRAGRCMLVFVVLTAVRTAGAQPVPIDLGTLGATCSVAQAVNDLGQVVGVFGDYCVGGQVRAFSWTLQGGMIDLGTLGGASSTARAVNSLGQVVGWSSTGSSTHAFLWTPGAGMTDLGRLGGLSSVAFAINDKRQVVGQIGYPLGRRHAFSWTPAGGMVDLGTLGGKESNAIAVNNAGQVVGWSTRASGDRRAFVWTAKEGMRELASDLPFSTASDVNEAGQVAGRADFGPGVHAFLWTADGGVTDLSTPDPYDPYLQSWGVALNDLGQVVGAGYEGWNSQRAFSWTLETGMVDLGTINNLGGDFSEARAVNNLGQIVGWSEIINDIPYWTHAFAATVQGGMIDLGTLGGAESYASKVSNAGHVVGWANTADETPHATLWLLKIDVTTVLNDLMARVANQSLQSGLTRALTAKLQAALASWTRGENGVSVNQLRSFVHQVDALHGTQLTHAQAVALAGVVNAVISAIQSDTAI